MMAQVCRVGTAAHMQSAWTGTDATLGSTGGTDAGARHIAAPATVGARPDFDTIADTCV